MNVPTGNVPEITIATVGATAKTRKPAVNKQMDIRARVKSFLWGDMPNLDCINLSAAGNMVVFTIMAAVARQDSK